MKYAILIRSMKLTLGQVWLRDRVGHHSLIERSLMAKNAKIIHFRLDTDVTWIDVYTQLLCGSMVTLTTTVGEVKFMPDVDRIRTDIIPGAVHFEGIEIYDQGGEPRIADLFVGVLFCDDRKGTIHDVPPPAPSEYQRMLDLIAQLSREERARVSA